MPAFQLVGLSSEPFAALFDLSSRELQERNARRVVADASSGYPCRVSLQDAKPGDELLLLPYDHQPADSPYRSSGPIFVRRGASQRVLPVNEVPEYVTRRLMSLRGYDAAHLIVAAEVCEGRDAAKTIQAMFADPAVEYIHLHNAKRGCYSCLARRA